MPKKDYTSDHGSPRGPAVVPGGPPVVPGAGESPADKGTGVTCLVNGCTRDAYAFGVCIEHRLEETAASPRELDEALRAIRVENRLAEEAEAKLAAQRLKDNPAPAGGSRYGQAALRGACQDIAALQEGSRNVELSRTAYRIGGLVGSGHIMAQDATDGLSAAAAACGLHRSEYEQVIRRGLREGAKKPWAPESKTTTSISAPTFTGAWRSSW